MRKAFQKFIGFLTAEHSRKILVAVSFCLTFGVLMIAFAARQFAPFGNKGLIAMDAYSQYFPMLKTMREALHSGSGFEYSFFGACGFDLWVQNAYYTNSPLWLPVYLVPESWMVSVVDLTVAVRMSLASAFCTLWLTREEEKNNLMRVLFGLCYGLCAWALAYMNQFMWTDAYMLLPLVALGIRRIAKGKSPVMYALCLGLTLWSNFYVGFMVCIFSAMWFGLYLSGENRIGKGKLFLRFLVGSLLAGGLASAVLIPTYIGLQQTVASTLGFEGKLELYNGIGAILAKLLPVSETSLVYEAPNIYCGLLCLPLGAVCLFSKKIPLSKKLIFSSLLVFMVLSFDLNLLDYIWHGFHYPNQLPGRQSFIFCFMLVTAADLGAKELENGLFFDRVKGIKFPLKKIMLTSVGIVLAAELAVNTFWTVGTQVWGCDLVNYGVFDSAMEKVLDKYSPGYRDFFRCETLTLGNHNVGQRYGFNGVTYYSSTMTQNTYRFFRSVKMPVYAKNVSFEYVPDPVCNALFGVRYVFDLDSSGEKIDSLSLYGLREAESIGNITVYENKWALPLGFVCCEEVLTYDPSAAASRTDALNGLLISTGATDKKLYSRMTERNVLDTLGFDSAFEALFENSVNITSFTPTKIKGELKSDKNGVLLFSIPQSTGWKLSIDGERVETKSAWGYFLAAETTAGEHSICLEYSTPGLTAGTVISVISAAMLIVFGTNKKIKAHFN